MRGLASLGYRSTWLLASILVHALAVGVVLLVWAPSPPRERPAVPVTLLEEETPPTDAEPPPEILHFRKASHPRVRETLEVPRQVLALKPPPPHAILEKQATASGLGIERRTPSPLTRFAAGGSGGGAAGSGVGMGNGEAPAGSFQEYVGGLRQAGLDVVFVIDATGSMGWLIEQVKERVRSLAAWIRHLVPVTRFGVVVYRDQDDPEFLVRVLPLTLRVAKVRGFLDGLEARGGGDIPEAVDAGLGAAIERVGWKPDSKRLIVIVGDAPPHPDRLAACVALARQFRAQGGTVTTVDVSFDANPAIAAAQLGKHVDELQTLSRRGVMPEFLRIAEAGGGDGATLEGDGRVVRQLAVLIFGRRWAEAVRPLLGDL